MHVRMWRAGESEEGLQGFCTKESRDDFYMWSDGPFLRVVTPPGGFDIRQMPCREARDHVPVRRCSNCYSDCWTVEDKLGFCPWLHPFLEFPEKRVGNDQD